MRTRTLHIQRSNDGPMPGFDSIESAYEDGTIAARIKDLPKDRIDLLVRASEAGTLYTHGPGEGTLSVDGLKADGRCTLVPGEAIY